MRDESEARIVSKSTLVLVHSQVKFGNQAWIVQLLYLCYIVNTLYAHIDRRSSHMALNFWTSPPPGSGCSHEAKNFYAIRNTGSMLDCMQPSIGRCTAWRSSGHNLLSMLRRAIRMCGGDTSRLHRTSRRSFMPHKTPVLPQRRKRIEM